MLFQKTAVKTSTITDMQHIHVYLYGSRTKYFTVPQNLLGDQSKPTIIYTYMYSLVRCASKFKLTVTVSNFMKAELPVTCQGP